MLEENGVYEKLTAKSKSMNLEAENYLPGGSSRAAAYFEPYPFLLKRLTATIFTMLMETNSWILC